MKFETIMLRTLFLASVLLVVGVMVAMLSPTAHPVRLAAQPAAASAAAAPMACPMITDQVICVDAALGML